MKITDFSPEGIRKILLTQKAMHGDKLFLFIKALETANYGNVVDILDEVNITSIKMSSVFLVDVAPDEKKYIEDAKL